MPEFKSRRREPGEDFAQWLQELKTPIEPTHYKQTGSTTTCGVNLHQIMALFTVDHAKVTCHKCEALRSQYLSKLGHPTEGTK